MDLSAWLGDISHWLLGSLCCICTPHRASLVFVMDKVTLRVSLPLPGALHGTDQLSILLCIMVRDHACGLFSPYRVSSQGAASGGLSHWQCLDLGRGVAGRAGRAGRCCPGSLHWGCVGGEFSQAHPWMLFAVLTYCRGRCWGDVAVKGWGAVLFSARVELIFFTENTVPYKPL